MAPSLQLCIPWIFIFALSWWVSKTTRCHSRQRGLPHPPGPKGYPIIGNLLHFPRNEPWLTFDKWFRTFGDITYIENLGMPMVILGSSKRARELLDKRSTIYSNRPQSIMIGEIAGGGFNFAFTPYGPEWRRSRRSFHKHFNMNQVREYDGIFKTETCTLLKRLLANPTDFSSQIRHVLGSIVMKVSYGITIQEENDPYIDRVEEAMIAIDEAIIPGRFLVDFIPIMKYIPTWFPGAGWKRWGLHLRDLNQLMIDLPYDHVVESKKDGTALPSIAASLLDQLPDEDVPNRAEEEKLAKNTPAVAYSCVYFPDKLYDTYWLTGIRPTAGINTMAATLKTFILGLCLDPATQQRAQEELDRVLGGRLPEFDDRDSLPYVNALIKECFRWHPVAPLVIRSSTEDDEYDGFFIPKESVIIANTWSMLRDPKVYSEPSLFLPERFLKDGRIDPDVQDPLELIFGFGRRICPGRYFADRIIFIIAASVLSKFNVCSPLGEDGEPVKLQVKFSGRTLSFPEDFDCRIYPRSRESETLLRCS